MKAIVSVVLTIVASANKVAQPVCVICNKKL